MHLTPSQIIFNFLFRFRQTAMHVSAQFISSFMEPIINWLNATFYLGYGNDDKIFNSELIQYALFSIPQPFG